LDLNGKPEFFISCVLLCFHRLISFLSSAISVFFAMDAPRQSPFFLPLAGSELPAFVACSVFFSFSSVSPLHPPLIRGSTVRQGLARFLSLLDFSSAARVGPVKIFPASAPLIAAVFFSPTRARVLHSPRLISAGFLGSLNLLVLLELAPDLTC
jgi:hypothetical protein